MEKLDGYTLMYLLKNTAGISIDELISYENLDYSSPTTVNRYLNKEKHPKFPTSLTIEMVQRTFANLQSAHFRDNADGFVNAMLRLLAHDLESPNAANGLRALYEAKRKDLDELSACRIMIDDLYIKCKNGYTDDGVSPIRPAEAAKAPEARAESGVSRRKLSEESFVSVLKSLKYLDEGETSLSGLGIVDSWIPGLTRDQEQYRNLTDYILKQAEAGTLSHSVFFAEPGAGKTYSVFAALKKLFKTDVTSGGTELIPVFVSSLLISINNTGITEFFAQVFTCGDKAAAAEAFRGDSDVRYLLFVDAVNESLNRDALLDEIIRLSYPVNRNITLIVSSNNADEDTTLQNSGFVPIRLNQLDAETVDAEVQGSALPAGLRALLRKPFYLGKYLSFRGDGYADDEYSVIDAYINNCKTNGKIVKPHESIDWIRLLDEHLPRLCYQCAVRNQMYISLNENAGEEYGILKAEQNVWRLVQIGVLKKYSEAVYFEHENYRNYFAAKYLYSKCRELCSHPNAPAELKTALMRESVALLQDAPANVCAILAQKLYNEKILFRLLGEYGPLIRDRGFYRLMISLFSFATRCLEGLDLRGADLWISDFSKFDKITDCDFSGADLNPETLWLHHARISYTSRNSGRLHNDLICLSGPEGFEIYNWKDDRQLFVRFEQPGIPDAWEVSDEALTLASGGTVYRIGMSEIQERLHSNTASVNEDLLLSERHIVSGKTSTDIRLNPMVKLNSRRDELSFQPGKELYVRMNGKSLLLKLGDTCRYATFIDDNRIFADCDGVYMIMTLDGILVWRRMIKPVIPRLVRRDRGGAVVEMQIPGILSPKYFRYTFDTQKMTFVRPDETVLKDIPDPEATDDGAVNDRLELLDDDNRVHCLFGGAIEFTGSVFEDATIVSRQIDENERQILTQFGGIVT